MLTVRVSHFILSFTRAGLKKLIDTLMFFIRNSVLWIYDHIGGKGNAFKVVILVMMKPSIVDFRKQKKKKTLNC